MLTCKISHSILRAESNHHIHTVHAKGAEETKGVTEEEMRQREWTKVKEEEREEERRVTTEEKEGRDKYRTGTCQVSDFIDTPRNG